MGFNRNIYLDVRGSLLALCRTLVDQEGYSDQIKIFDFDAHAANNELPSNDLIGIGEYTLSNDQELLSGSVSIVMMTSSTDKQIIELSRWASKIFDFFQPMQRFDVVTREGGVKCGTLIITPPVQALPVASTETRPMVEFLVPFAVVSPETPLDN